MGTRLQLIDCMFCFELHGLPDSQRLLRRSRHLGRSLEVKVEETADVLQVKDEDARGEKERKEDEKTSGRKKKLTKD